LAGASFQEQEVARSRARKRAPGAGPTPELFTPPFFRDRRGFLCCFRRFRGVVRSAKSQNAEAVFERFCVLFDSELHDFGTGAGLEREAGVEHGWCRSGASLRATLSSDTVVSKSSAMKSLVLALIALALMEWYSRRK
jgi:hypothetical protein